MLYGTVYSSALNGIDAHHNMLFCSPTVTADVAATVPVTPHGPPSQICCTICGSAGVSGSVGVGGSVEGCVLEGRTEHIGQREA